MIPSLFFKAKAFQTMLAYVDGVRTEIGWIGKIEEDNFGIPVVTEVKLLPQKVSAANVMITAQMMGEFFESLPDEEKPLWSFNGHSHVNMGVSPSGTDIDNYEGFVDHFDVFTAIIVNKRREFTGLVYGKKPVSGAYSYRNVAIYEAKKHARKLKSIIQEGSSMRMAEAICHVMGLGLTKKEKEAITQEIEANIIKPEPMVQQPGTKIISMNPQQAMQMQVFDTGWGDAPDPNEMTVEELRHFFNHMAGRGRQPRYIDEEYELTDQQCLQVETFAMANGYKKAGECEYYDPVEKEHVTDREIWEMMCAAQVADPNEEPWYYHEEYEHGRA